MTFIAPHTATIDGLTIERFTPPTELTIEQTARFLRMSERHVNDLLDSGEIASRQESSERLVQWESLLAFELERERGHKVLDEMVRLNQEMGLYDD